MGLRGRSGGREADMMGYGYGPGGWAYVFMMGSILFWLLLALGVIAVVRYLPREGRQVRRPTPAQVLAERLARGEIDDAEYTRRLETLRRAEVAVEPSATPDARPGASTAGR